ncbi:type II secretion system secretin GspD [Acidovorax sp. HDW3]|uniref:type II secretion system secretin GspD n=1 Tax=Acidovorax sp. HDW3 TaxID=2714923 RepID=UPI00140869CE|nr:type II secretion system secretin GspD [Acidovorax sp. HDW3]QIL43012.1 type II secretion system secretin GspD [Acidovorax sp. HDW3]
MTFKRPAIPLAVLALAACAAPADKSATPAEASPPPIVVKAAPEPAPAPQQPASPAAAKEGAVDTGVPNKQESRLEPRIIKGDDQVIAPPRNVPSLEGPASAFKFEDAPISEVVHVMMRDILKVGYELHHPVAGSITLDTRVPVTPDNAVAMLESALLANGLILVRDTRGVFHVGKPDVLRNIGTSVRQPYKGGLPPGYGAIVVPLQYIGASEMATILKPLMPTEALVRVDNVRNLLVLAGTRVQAEGWLDLVNTFDVNMLKGMSVGVFPLKHASIAEVEAALQLLGSASGAGSAAGGAPAVARTGAAQPAGAVTPAPAASPVVAIDGDSFPLRGALRILPIARINSILVVTPRAAYLEEARRWIEKLDQPSDNGADPQLHIYKVENGNAKHLAGVLAGIFGGTAAGGTQPTGVAPGLNSAASNTFGQFGNNFGGNWGNNSGGTFGTSAGNSFGRLNSGGGGLASQNRQGLGGTAGFPAGTTATPIVANIGSVRVMADELNNSILVWSTRAEFLKIESTLKRLDLPPTQVLIDASIIEVTLNDSLQYGLQWAFSGGTGGGRTGIGQLSTGSNNPNNSGSLNVAAGSGFSYSLINSAGNVRVVLNALASQDLLKVISSPSLMVLDNHTATMAVGDQVPVLTSTTDILTTTGAVTSTVQYRDTGVSLAVTPSVNSGNLVTMQIDQTMTDQSASVGANNQPIFLQRQIGSKVAVRSGETIVLGGLIKDNRTSGKAGVPVLKDVPLLGNLFSNTNDTGKRTELLVVITPKVVRTDPEIREVSEELRDRLKGLGIIEMRDRAKSTPASSALQPSPPQ